MRRAALLAAIPVLAAVPTAVAAPVLQRPGRPRRSVRRRSPRARLVTTPQPFRGDPRRADPPLAPVLSDDRLAPPTGPPAAAPARPAAAAARPHPSFSTTNNQEQGVDEPDTVKTNGSTIFTVSGNKLYAVAVNGGKPQLAGSLALGSGGAGAQLSSTAIA